MQRYFYGMVCVIAHEDFCAGVVKEVGVQGEVLLGRRIE